MVEHPSLSLVDPLVKQEDDEKRTKDDTATGKQ